MSAIGNALARIVEMQETLIAGSQAVRVALYSQPGEPFWTNNVSIERVEDSGASIITIIYNVTMVLQRGKLTEQFDTEQEADLQDEIESAAVYFAERRYLQTATVTTRLPEIAGRGCTLLSAALRAPADTLNGVIVLSVPIVKAINPL